MSDDHSYRNALTDGRRGDLEAAPRPRPDSAGSGFDNWSEPNYSEAEWGSDDNPVVTTDGSGRHSLPEERDPQQQRAGSYGEFLVDPPYDRSDDEPVPSDAGNPPRPSPVGRPRPSEDTMSISTVGMPVGGAPSMSPDGVEDGPFRSEAYGSGADSYYGSLGSYRADPYRGSAAQPQSMAGPEAGPRDTVTCPECGKFQEVHLSRRDATDFCVRCDYPLFWTPSQVVRDRAQGDHSEALRRLPGTVGRSTLASVPCPFCAELNLVSAQTCVRCARSMHPVAPPPPAVYVPPPPPVYEPEPEPETGIPWWVWLLVALGSAIVIALVVWYAIAHN